MKYLLLSPLLKNDSSYKGLMRWQPEHTEKEPEQTVWFNYASQIDDFGFFSSFESVLKIYKDYIELGKEFEIIGCLNVTKCDKEEKTKTSFPLTFLGYDINNQNGHSLLNEFGYTGHYNPEIIFLDKNVFRELSLSYFSDRLNENRLLSNYIDARNLLMVEQEIITIDESLNFLHSEEYFIYKIFKVHV